MSHDRASAAPGPSASRGEGARFRYDAFISYSRALDGKLAPALQNSLQRFAKPWYRLRALRVFRDDASLSANPNLWSAITDAIDSAQFFVLLASPQASASTWVDREVAYWLERRSVDSLLIALTEGEITWDERLHGFDSAGTTAIPPSLAGAFTDEPRYTDLRWARREAHLSLRDPRFRDGTADIAATIRGQPKDDILSEDIRQHRRTVRLAIATILVLAVLATAASIAGIIAVDQRNTARAQRDLATSRYLAALAVSSSEDDLPRSLLASLAALHVRDTPEARSALLAGLQQPIPELTRFLASEGPTVRSVDVSPDGQVVAAADASGRVSLWSVEGRRRLVTPAEPGSGISEVTFSPRGELLAGAGSRGIVLWNTKTWKPVGTLKTAADSVSFSPDGKTLVSGGGVITIWNVARRQVVKEIGRGTAETTPVALSPDGAIVAAGSSDGVTLWAVSSGRRLVHLDGFSKSVGGVAFSPDGRLVAAGGFLGQLVLWDVARRREVRALVGQSDSIRSIAFSDDGTRLLSAGDDRKILVWDVHTGRRVRTLSGHTGSVSSVAIAHDDETVVSGGDDGSLIAWNLKPEPRLNVRLPGSDADELAFTPNGRTLVTGSNDGELVLWDVRTKRRVASWTSSEYEALTPLAVSPDGHAVAAGGSSNTYVWQLTARRTLSGPHTLPGDYADALSFSSRTKTLAAAEGDNAKIVLWDLERNRPLDTQLAPGGSTAQIAFSPDGKTAASGSFGGTLTFWDLGQRRRLETIKAHTGEVSSLAFSPDGKTLASSGQDGTIILWNVADRTRLERPLALPGLIGLTLAFSPDGKTLVSNGRAGTLILWDVQSRRRLGTIAVGAGALSGFNVAFSKDGSTVATSGSPILLWDVGLASWKRRACAIANRNLTRLEWAELAGSRPYRRVCPAG